MFFVTETQISQHRLLVNENLFPVNVEGFPLVSVNENLILVNVEGFPGVPVNENLFPINV